MHAQDRSIRFCKNSSSHRRHWPNSNQSLSEHCNAECLFEFSMSRDRFTITHDSRGRLELVFEDLLDKSSSIIKRAEAAASLRAMSGNESAAQVLVGSGIAFVFIEIIPQLHDLSHAQFQIDIASSVQKITHWEYGAKALTAQVAVLQTVVQLIHSPSFSDLPSSCCALFCDALRNCFVFSTQSQRIQSAIALVSACNCGWEVAIAACIALVPYCSDADASMAIATVESLSLLFSCFNSFLVAPGASSAAADTAVHVCFALEALFSSQAHSQALDAGKPLLPLLANIDDLVSPFSLSDRAKLCGAVCCCLRGIFSSDEGVCAVCSCDAYLAVHKLLVNYSAESTPAHLEMACYCISCIAMVDASACENLRRDKSVLLQLLQLIKRPVKEGGTEILMRSEACRALFACSYKHAETLLLLVDHKAHDAAILAVLQCIQWISETGVSDSSVIACAQNATELLSAFCEVECRLQTLAYAGVVPALLRAIESMVLTDTTAAAAGLALMSDFSGRELLCKFLDTSAPSLDQKASCLSALAGLMERRPEQRVLCVKDGCIPHVLQQVYVGTTFGRAQAAYCLYWIVCEIGLQKIAVDTGCAQGLSMLYRSSAVDDTQSRSALACCKLCINSAFCKRLCQESVPQVVSDVLRVADGIVGHSSLRLLCALALQDCGLSALTECNAIDALDVRMAVPARLAADEVECALLVSSLVALRSIGGIDLALRWLGKFWQVPEGMQDDEVDSDVYEPPPPATDIAKAALEGAGAIAAAALLKIQSSSAHRKVVAQGMHVSPGNMPAVLKKLSGKISELEVLDV